MNQPSGLKLYGIIGHPIGHSLSPLMHNTAFEALGLSASMSAFDIEPQSLKEALQGFMTMEFGGINVTIPHKESIIPLLDVIDEEASIIGAVNTVKFQDRRTIGFNTDAFGFLQTLEPIRSSIDGGKFVVLGSGGAARAVVYVLLKHFRTSQIVIASRSISHANDLIEHFKGSNQTKLSPFDPSNPQFARIFEASDVVINATPAGMFPKTNELPIPNPPFRAGQTAMDLIYRPVKTQFLQRASHVGARIISGLEMFVHQGARAFEIWTGLAMNTQLVHQVISRKLEEEA
jgi:shikimate 5-dehydrogenase